MAIFAIVKGIDCQTCPVFYQKARGCKVNLENPATIAGIKTYQCPRKYNVGTTRAYLELYYYFKQGVLPCRGELPDQPMKLMQIFKIIEDLIDQLEDKGDKNVN